jgi:hypothetical protein
VPGWASVLLSVLFIGGIQLLVLGIMGEYLGKLFVQAKGRPPYLVQATDAGLQPPGRGQSSPGPAPAASTSIDL